MPEAAYLSKASLAKELQVSETTVDEMVRRGVLPKPVRLSAGCIRWRWATVDAALASMLAPADDSRPMAGGWNANQKTTERGSGRAT